MRLERRHGRDVVVKDVSGQSLLLRAFVGRRAHRREIRAYRRLAGTPGVPALLETNGHDVIVLERVGGRPLGDWAATELPASSLDRLDAVIAEIHQRGVAIADLHRSNVLVDGEGAVHIVDFAMARISRSPQVAGPLVRSLQRLDRHAAARIRARCEGRAEPRLGGMLGVVYRLGRTVKRLLHGRLL